MKNAKSVAKLTFAIVIIALMIVVVFLIFISQLSKDNNETQTNDVIELTFVCAYQNEQWSKAILESVNRFNESRSDIHVTCNVQYEDQVYDEALNRLYATDNLGDIVQLKTPYYFAECGALSEIPIDVYDDVKNVYKYRDRVYGVSAVTTTVGIVYNRALFDRYNIEEPKTYQEFLQICRKFKDNKVTPLLVAGSDLWHLEFLYNHYFQSDFVSNNPDWTEDEDFSFVDSEDMNKAMYNLKNLFDKEFVNDEWLITEDSSTAYLMTQNSAAMLYTGSWTSREIHDINENFDIGWFYIPNDDGTCTVSETNDAYLCLTKECSNDEDKYNAAIEFLKFFYSEDNYDMVLETLNGISALKDSQNIERNELWQKIVTGYESSDKQTNSIGDESFPQGFEKSVLTDLRKMLNAELSIRQFLKTCDKAWNKEEL